MSDESAINVETGEMEISDRLDEPYRLRFHSQIMILIGIFIVTVFFLDYSDTSLDVSLLLILVEMAIFFPFVVKDVNVLTQSVSFGLFFATLFTVAGYIVMSVDDLSDATIGLLVAALVVFGVQLFEHLSPFAIKYDLLGWIIIISAGLMFFAGISVFLNEFDTKSIFYVGIPVTLLFIFAILPEKPI